VNGLLHASAATALLAIGALLAAAPAPAVAQELLPGDTAEVVDGVTPRGAFLRSLLVPGWGHVVTGAPRRGAVYAGLAAGSWFMVGKTLHRYGEARDILASFRLEARDSLHLLALQDTAWERRIQDPDTLAARIAADPRVTDATGLLGARRQQREDWVTWLAFLTLANALDAYVSAHLADSPARVSASARRDGGVNVGVRLRIREPW
jgi:hypothetical protein